MVRKHLSGAVPQKCARKRENIQRLLPMETMLKVTREGIQNPTISVCANTDTWCRSESNIEHINTSNATVRALLWTFLFDPFVRLAKVPKMISIFFVAPLFASITHA